METLNPDKIKEIGQEVELVEPKGYSELPTINKEAAEKLSNHEVSIMRIDDGRFVLIDIRRELIDNRTLIKECENVQETQEKIYNQYEQTKEVNDDYMIEIKKHAQYNLEKERARIRKIQQEAIKTVEQIEETKEE
jgi:hypothetical protein